MSQCVGICGSICMCMSKCTCLFAGHICTHVSMSMHVFMNLCVCMCVCAVISMHTLHLPRLVHAFMHACMCTCVLIKCAYMHDHTCTHMCLHVLVICIYACPLMYMYMSGYKYINIYVCMSTHLSVYVCLLCMFLYTNCINVYYSR